MGGAGYSLAALEYLNRCARHAHGHLGPHMLARPRVVVAADLNVVVVGTTPRHRPFGVLELGLVIGPAGSPLA